MKDFTLKTARFRTR